ncbi:YggS family pyridoxal phosphate-dependent enzyme [candidate division KSB1 bacterium]|nr:YggS family pyridoxal phosphate-dependent enzyme [candidate division KSB1 bacterium]
MTWIEDSARHIIDSLPDHVTLVAAAKTRSVDEVRRAIDAGVKILGYNYVQEAMTMRDSITQDVKWHMIGHLQRNKVNRAVPLFDMIETIDSFELAKAVDRQCKKINKMMPILLEINIGREAQKSGILPENVLALAQQISTLQHVEINGLMTMGPVTVEPGALRPYFKLTKILFDQIAAARIPHVEMKYLSMGMSDSYEIAIEEGANMIRLGTILFGPRHDKS